MNLHRLRALVAERAGEPARGRERADFAELEPALEDGAIREYLLHCLPDESYGASGVTVLGPRAIRDEVRGAPGQYLLPYDYVPIATSVGGNVVVVHAWGDRGAKVFWADHTSFGDDSICYQDRATGEWIDLEPGHTPEKIARALLPLGPDLETFLVALLGDRLTGRLDALD